MSAVDPAALDAEVSERIAAQVAASVARREQRRQERADLAQRRTAGLRRRHARKLARQRGTGLGSSRCAHTCTDTSGGDSAA